MTLLARLIERKRDGGRIAPHEWEGFAHDYGEGKVPDYHVAALLMAAYLNGHDRDETAAHQPPFPYDRGIAEELW